MPDRRPFVAANWKMHKTLGEWEAFLDAFLPAVEEYLETVDVVVCPPFLALGVAVESCRGKRVRVAAQNMNAEPEGAFTGEISAPMLTDIGVEGVILGHSERRRHFGETDAEVARKVVAALDAGLQPILCIGESEAERDSHRTEEVLRRQLEADLEAVPNERLADMVIAYEPVWAIGTGHTATEAQAQEATAFIRARLSDRQAAAADAVRILYGGSVKPGNARELFSQPDIDGALVGGASLEPQDFLAIVAAAA
jgi:triosephosphate isomerase (TIM)